MVDKVRHEVASRAEYLARREALLVEEQAHIRRGDELARNRRLRFGAHCTRCCGPAMLAIGMANPAAIVGASVAITVERLVPRPRRFRQATGVLAIAGGLGYAAFQL
jgi:hypothetical protein